MKKQKILRTAFLRAQKFQDMDTCSIAHIYDYHFLEALYSPLVRVSYLDGQMYTSAAQKFEISGNWIEFHLRDDIVTVDGHHVTADDAAFSLKRVLLCNTNMHGNLSSFLDLGPIKNINDSVDGVIVDGLRLSLRMKSNADPQLVLRFLSSIDFAIIPKASVDPISLKVTDKRNTTGPYYLSTDDESYLFSLIANANHWALGEKSPQLINVLPASTREDLIELFETNKIDFIGQPNEINFKDKVQLSRTKNQNIQLHTTDYLFLLAFTFTDRGIREFSTEKRLAIASMLQNIYKEKILPKTNIDGDFLAATKFLLLESSFGGLRGSERDKCLELMERHKTPPLEKIRIAVPEDSIEEFKKAYSDLSHQIDFVVLPKTNTYQDHIMSKDFDLFHLRFDVADKEDSTLIGMLFHFGFFRPLSKDEFIEAYVTQQDQDKREKMLQDLHYQAICKNPTIVPLAKMRLASLAKNGWHIPIPKRFVGVPFFDLEFQEGN